VQAFDSPSRRKDCESQGRLEAFRDPAPPPLDLPVWKLHGSANQGYCDLSWNLITSESGLRKIAVRSGWLEPEDFACSEAEGALRGTPEQHSVIVRNAGVAVRVAKFSYRKHLDVPFFQSIRRRHVTACAGRIDGWSSATRYRRRMLKSVIC
jgi:hypothetical protein